MHESSPRSLARIREHKYSRKIHAFSAAAVHGDLEERKAKVRSLRTQNSAAVAKVTYLITDRAISSPSPPLVIYSRAIFSLQLTNGPPLVSSSSFPGLHLPSLNKQRRRQLYVRRDPDFVLQLQFAR